MDQVPTVCLSLLSDTQKKAYILKAGDVVLDLFGGSGTTIIVCEQNGRNTCLIELDPKYVDVIIDRWQESTDKEAVRSDGVKLNDLWR